MRTWFITGAGHLTHQDQPGFVNGLLREVWRAEA